MFLFSQEYGSILNESFENGIPAEIATLTKGNVVGLNKEIRLYYTIEEPKPVGVTATWSIEDGAELTEFENVTVTFAGADTLGRVLGVEVTEISSITSTIQILHSVAEDGTATAIGILPATKDGLSVKYSVEEDKGYNLVDGKLLKNGQYRIVIPKGVLVFNPRPKDETGANLPVVKNDVEFVLNFSIKNDYVEKVDPIAVDAAFTANPADNSTLLKLSEVEVTFTDKTAVTIGELSEQPRPDVWPFLNQTITLGSENDELGGGMVNSQPVAPMYCEVVEGKSNAVRFYIASDFVSGTTEITTKGTYTLTIPAGVVKFSETEINKAITLNYTITALGTNVDVVITDNIYTYNGTIMADSDIQIFTITGQNVTNMNGNLQNGVYIVKTANTATKVVIK